MNLETLATFIRVAELGSVTRAALVIGSTQSSVSKRIRELESELETRLFHRTGRGVAVTESGKHLLDRAQDLMADVDRLREEVSSARGVPKGTVHLAVQPSVACPLVSLVFAKVRERFAGIRLHIMEGIMGQMDEWLAEERIDIGVISRYRKAQRADEEFLFASPLYLVGRRNAPETAAGTISFARLANLSLVVPRVPHGIRIMIDEVAHRRRIAHNVVLEVDSLSLMKDIAASGQGFTIAAYQAVAPELAVATLSVARITQPGLEQEVVLVTGKKRSRSLAVRAVKSIVRETVRELLARGTWRSA